MLLCIHNNRLAAQVQQSPGKVAGSIGGWVVFTIVCPDSVIADPPSCWRAGLPVEMVCRQVKLMLKQAVMII